MLHCLLSGLYRNAFDEEFVLIEGGAAGADNWAAMFAVMMAPGDCKENGGRFEHLRFEADWKSHGKAAGPIRNQQMLDVGKPSRCFAFLDKPLDESPGTSDMVRRCRSAGVPVVVITCESGEVE